MDGSTPPYMSRNANRNANGDDRALYVKVDLPSIQTSFKNTDKDVEHIFFKSTSKKNGCSPHLQFVDKHLAGTGKELDSLSSKYNYILMDNFNADL